MRPRWRGGWGLGSGGWVRLCGLPGELEEVVGRADERPLVGHLRETAEGKATEASTLLHLTEDRLDHLLAEPVATSMTRAIELGPHGHRAGPEQLAATGLALLVRDAPGGDVSTYSPPDQRLQVRLR